MPSIATQLLREDHDRKAAARERVLPIIKAIIDEVAIREAEIAGLRHQLALMKVGVFVTEKP